jgi:hypothetical protein
MATTTPLNAWPVPTSTDYVKDGATAIEALGDAIDASVGSGLLAWQSYTPTFTNFTLGNGTIARAKYVKLGKNVLVEISVILGTTSSVTGRITMSLPVTGAFAVARTNDPCSLFAGAVSGVGSVAMSTTTQVELFALNSAGTYLSNVSTSATVPGTWANTNYFSFRTMYEAA